MALALCRINCNFTRLTVGLIGNTPPIEAASAKAHVGRPSGSIGGMKGAWGDGATPNEVWGSPSFALSLTVYEQVRKRKEGEN